MKKKKTVMIFGITSFVGSSLASFLRKDYRIIGTYYSSPSFIPGIMCIFCDVMNRDLVQMLIYSFKPEITIYCVGLSSIESCEKEEQFAQTLNTIGLFNVSTFSERYKSKICYISTAHIFPGYKKVYAESDSPDPSTTYGKTKGSAEFFMQKSCLNYVIFRCCSLYGRSLNPKQRTPFETLERKLIRKEEIICDGDINVGFLDPYYLAMIIKMAIDEDVTNRLFQVCTQDVLSFYDFAKLLTKIFQFDDGLLVRGKWPFTEMKREVDMSELASKRYFHLNIENVESFFRISLPSIEESLKFTYARFSGVVDVKGKKSAGPSIKYI